MRPTQADPGLSGLFSECHSASALMRRARLKHGMRRFLPSLSAAVITLVFLYIYLFQFASTDSSVWDSVKLWYFQLLSFPTLFLFNVGALSERCCPKDVESCYLPLQHRNVARLARLARGSAAAPPALFSGGGGAPQCGAGKVNVSIASNPAHYADSESCMLFLRSIPDSKFCEPVIFHAFWGTLPVRKHVVWFLLSFLSTQDLSHSQLWLWSPTRPSEFANDPIVKSFGRHPNIRIKHWDASSEFSKIDSPVAAKFPNAKSVVASAHDSKYWLDSDLFRVLTLLRYGGVYVDTDLLFLRDFGPILGHEFLYQWGSNCVSANGAVMRMFSNSALANELLGLLLATPPRPLEFDWGRDMYVKITAKENFVLYPTCFFNPVWMIGKYHQFYQPSKPWHAQTWHGAFAFHLHGEVFSLGPTAHAESSYASALREVGARFSAVDNAFYKKLVRDGLVDIRHRL